MGNEKTGESEFFIDGWIEQNACLPVYYGETERDKIGLLNL
jgi:hypothetical protein